MLLKICLWSLKHLSFTLSNNLSGKKLLRGFYYTMIHITNNIACYIEICNPTSNMLILGTFM